MNTELLAVAVVTGAMLLGLLILAAVANRWIIVVPPHRLLVLSGLPTVGPDGARVGFRLVRGGRVFRIPVLQHAAFLDVGTLAVDFAPEGKLTADGTRMGMGVFACVRVAGDALTARNAVERFLGRPREEMAAVARETLEQVLCGVLAGLTTLELVREPLRFSELVREAASGPMSKLGLELETLGIRGVWEDDGRLNRMAAEALRAAELGAAGTSAATRTTGPGKDGE